MALYQHPSESARGAAQEPSQKAISKQSVPPLESRELSTKAPKNSTWARMQVKDTTVSMHILCQQGQDELLRSAAMCGCRSF